MSIFDICDPSALIEQAKGEPIAILNNNSPTAYLIPTDTDKRLLERLEDYKLGLFVKDRQNEKKAAIDVSIDDL